MIGKKYALTLIDFCKISTTRQNLVKTHLWALSKEKKTAMLLQLWLLMRENAQNDPILIGFLGKKYQTKFVKIHLWALSKEKKTAMLLQPWLLIRYRTKFLKWSAQGLVF